MYILPLQFYQDSEIQSLCQGRDCFCGFLHCLALCFIQALLKLPSAPKIETACRGRCRLKYSDPFPYSNPNTNRWDKELPLMKGCFPKLLTTPNQSRMFCFSEPLRKERQYFSVSLSAWLNESVDSTMYVRKEIRETFSLMRNTLWGIYATMTAPSLFIFQLCNFKTWSSPIKADEIIMGDCITIYTIRNKEPFNKVPKDA